MGSALVEPSTKQIEGWRMALLLLAFATVTFILEKTIHLLENAVKSRMGLAIALEHIKNEVLCVGSISLLLSAFQNLLARICIPLSNMSIYTDRRRTLLAGATADYCGPTGQSLWPVGVQHDTHIFIFVVACTHIVYGTITVYLTIWRVKSWQVWEQECQEEGRRNNDLYPVKMSDKFLYKNVGSHPVIHFFLMLFRQYQMSVNKSLYSNARLLFIEKMKKEYDFDFHSVVVKGLETELMTTLHPEWHLWLIAVVWYAIPPPAYVSFWMYGLSVLIIVLVGGKLVDILVQLSVQVAIKYGDSVTFGRMKKNPLANGGVGLLGRSSMRAPADSNWVDRIGGFLTPWGGAGRDGAGGDGEGDGAAGAASASAAPQVAAAATALPPLAGVNSPRGSLRASILKPPPGAEPSLESAVQMLRTMASELSGGSGSGRRGGSAAAAAAAAVAAVDHQDQQQPVAVAQQPSEASQMDVEPAAAAEEDAAAAAGPAPSRPLLLTRISAPAALRQSYPLQLRFAHPMGSGGGDDNDDGGGPAMPNGGKRVLSVIMESRGGSQLAAPQGTTSLHRRLPLPHAHPPTRPRHNHPRLSSPRASKKASSPPHQQQQQQAPTHGSEGRASTVARRSAFELAQASPDQKPHTLSLRRVFHGLGLGLRGSGSLDPESPPPPPSSSPKQLQQQHQKQGSGRSFHERVRNGDGGTTVPDGGGGGSVMGCGSAEAGSAPRASQMGSPGASPSLRWQQQAEAAEAAAGEVEDDGGCASGSDDEGGGGGGRMWGRRRTASGRRKVPLLLRPCYCGVKYRQGSKQYVKDLLHRRKARAFHSIDAKEFFWFGKPRFMTSLFTLAYFQNSLSIAICIFSLAGMQDSVSTWQGVPTWAIFLQLGLDLLLVPQVSLSILPFYALIQPLGSHCPQGLLELADEDSQSRMGLHTRLGARMRDISHQIGRSVANFNFTNEPPTSPNATTTPPSSPANDQRGSHRSFLGGLLDRLPAALRGNSANSPNSQRHRTGSGPQEEAAAAAGEEAQQRQQPGAGGMQRAGSQAGAVAGEAALRERRLTINTQQQQQLQLRPSQSFGAAPAALRCGSGSGSGNGGMPRQESANGRINGRKSSSGVAGPLSRLGGVPASMRGSASPRLSRIGREQQLQPAAAQQPGGRSAAGAGANGGGYVVGAPAPDRSSPLSGAKRPQPPQPQSPALPLQPSEQQPQPPSSPPLQPLQPPQVQVLVQVEIGPGEVAVAGQAATEAAAAEAPCSSGSSGSSGESGRAVLGGVDRMGRASPPPLPVHPEPYAAEGDAAAGAPPVGRQEV